MLFSHFPVCEFHKKDQQKPVLMDASRPSNSGALLENKDVTSPSEEDASDAMTAQRQQIAQHEDRNGSLSELDDSDDPEALERSKSTRSIADTLPWYRELLFVAVICLGQLFTRKSHTSRSSQKERYETDTMEYCRGRAGPGPVDSSYHRRNLGT